MPSTLHVKNVAHLEWEVVAVKVEAPRLEPQSVTVVELAACEDGRRGGRQQRCDAAMDA
jgi:hypothetical protein